MAIQLGVSYPVPGALPTMNAAYSYKRNADGTIGIDYFAHGEPVTNIEFSALTLMDTTSLEQAANAGSTAPPPVPNLQTSGSQEPAGLSAQEYDGILKAYNMSKDLIDKAHTSGLMDYDQKVRAVGNLKQGLDRDLKLAMGENRGYFSSVSPNAYQSQKKNYDSDVVEQYNLGQKNVGDYEARLGQAKNEWDANYNASLFNAEQSKNALLASNKAGSSMDAGTYGFTGAIGSAAPASAGYTPMSATAARAGGGAVAQGQQGRSVADYNTGTGAPIEEYLQTGMV